MESVYARVRHQQRVSYQGKCQHLHIALDCKGPGCYLSVFVYLWAPKTIGQGAVVIGERMRGLGKKRKASRKGNPAQSPLASCPALGSYPSKRKLWPQETVLTFSESFLFVPMCTVLCASVEGRQTHEQSA